MSVPPIRALPSRASAECGWQASVAPFTSTARTHPHLRTEMSAQRTRVRHPTSANR